MKTVDRRLASDICHCHGLYGGRTTRAGDAHRSVPVRVSAFVRDPDPPGAHLPSPEATQPRRLNPDRHVLSTVGDLLTTESAKVQLILVCCRIYELHSSAA